MNILLATIYKVFHFLLFSFFFRQQIKTHSNNAQKENLVLSASEKKLLSGVGKMIIHYS